MNYFPNIHGTLYAKVYNTTHFRIFKCFIYELAGSSVTRRALEVTKNHPTDEAENSSAGRIVIRDLPSYGAQQAVEGDTQLQEEGQHLHRNNGLVKHPEGDHTNASRA